MPNNSSVSSVILTAKVFTYQHVHINIIHNYTDHHMGAGQTVTPFFFKRCSAAFLLKP